MALIMLITLVTTVQCVDINCTNGHEVCNNYKDFRYLYAWSINSKESYYAATGNEMQCYLEYYVSEINTLLMQSECNSEN